MNVILDAGALIALDRDDRRINGLLVLARRAGAVTITVAPAVTQAWRDGSRQALLARTLQFVDVRPVDDRVAREAGVLLGKAGMSDAVDALVALLAMPGDQVMTSDVDDLSELLQARGIKADVVRV